VRGEEDAGGVEMIWLGYIIVGLLVVLMPLTLWMALCIESDVRNGEDR
jgi:hypothetical protein